MNADKKLISDFVVWASGQEDTSICTWHECPGGSRWEELDVKGIDALIDTFIALRATGRAPDVDAAVYALPDGSRYELTRTLNDLANKDGSLRPMRKHLRAAVEHVASMDPADRRDLSRPLLTDEQIIVERMHEEGLRLCHMTGLGEDLSFWLIDARDERVEAVPSRVAGNLVLGKGRTLVKAPMGEDPTSIGYHNDIYLLPEEAVP